MRRGKVGVPLLVGAVSLGAAVSSCAYVLTVQTSYPDRQPFRLVDFHEQPRQVERSTTVGDQTNPSRTEQERTHDENILWWQGVLGGVRLLEGSGDGCEGCDPEVSSLFKGDADLARLARRQVEQDRNQIGPRLICGVIDTAEEFPDCVAIRIGRETDDFEVVGSGVVLADRQTVLTVKHVMDRVGDDDTVRVVIGINALTEGGNEALRIASVGPPSMKGKIVALRLADPIPDHVRLPHREVLNQDAIKKGDRIIVSGYGRDTTDVNQYGKRQIVSVFVAEAPCCSKPPDYGCKNDIEFVASQAAENDSRCDSCWHDSGGPAYAKRGEDWHIIGLTEGPIPREKAEALDCRPKGSCGCGARYVYATLYDD